MHGAKGYSMNIHEDGEVREVRARTARVGGVRPFNVATFWGPAAVKRRAKLVLPFVIVKSVSLL